MFNDIVNFLLVTLTAFFLITGCSRDHRTSGGEIEAVYWHEGQRYTVVTLNADIVEHHKIVPWGNPVRGAVTLYTDAVPGEKSWYKCEWDWSNWDADGGDTAYCDIHIHNLDELGTADWNHGKFGTGSTTRID